MQFNANRPFSAFNVPVHGAGIPGPTASLGTCDDGATITAYNLAPEYLSLPVVNTYDNVPGDSDYYTLEVTATKRMSNRWSGMFSFTHTWSEAQEKDYFGQVFRQNDLPITPNDLINAAADGKVKYTDWSLKLHGTYEGPFGLKISPMLRHQAGQNYGRTFTAVLNYGTIRIPAEPLNTRRQDNVSIFDFRAEKVFRVDAGHDVRAVHRPLQRVQRKSRAEHHLGVGVLVPAAHEHRSAARGSHRRQSELVGNVVRHALLRHICVSALLIAGCSSPSSEPAPPAVAAPAVPALGIRPNGDTEISPDMSQVHSEELKKVYAYIDEHIDEHVGKLQSWIRQPSISNSGEGIPESAEMVKGFFEELGCQESQGLRRRHDRMGRAGQPGRLRALRRGRATDAGHLLDVRHDAGDAARRLGGASVRRPPGRAGAVQESPDRARRDELEGAADGPAQRVHGHQGGRGQAAGESDLRRGRRRRADVDRLPPVRQDASRAVQGCRGDVSLRRPERERRRRAVRRIGRVRLRRADDQRREMGPRPDGLGHPRREQAQRRQPGMAAHADAEDAGVGRRQPRADTRLLREHRAAVAHRDGEAGGGGEERRHEDRGGEPRRRALHRRRSAGVPQDGALRHVDEPRRHLGRQHVCGRGRRDPPEQDHVEAQLPLPPEAGRHRHHEEAAGASRRAGLR